MYMINLEKMNDVVISLEEVANNLSKISEITKILNDSVSSNQDILKTIKDYDRRTYDLKDQIDGLIRSLNNIESTYKLERESYNTTQEKLKEFNDSVNNLNDKVIDKLEEYIVLLNEYDGKREELNNHIVSLLNKLEEIRSDYHKVSSSFELVETDLKQFGSKIDLQKIENEKRTKELENQIETLQTDFNEKYSMLLKDNKILKTFLIISISLIVIFGIVSIVI